MRVDEGHAGRYSGDAGEGGGAFIHDLISFLEGSGNVGSTIEGCVKAVRNWMTWNDLQIPGRIKVFGSSENPTVEDEVTPTTGYAYKALKECPRSVLLRAADLRVVWPAGRQAGPDALRRALLQVLVEVQSAAISKGQRDGLLRMN